MKLSLCTLPILVLLLAVGACQSQEFPDFARERAQAQKEMAANAPLTVSPPAIEPKGVIPADAPALKVALLLPLSGDSQAVGNAMQDAAMMAISDSYFTIPSEQIHSKVILMPKDTGNTPADSEKAVRQALNQGASFVVGPLFSQSVRVVAPLLQPSGVGMITFSNNRSVASKGVYLFGFLPEEQVVRVAEYAYLHNLERVALLAPNDSYGEKVKKTLIDSYSRKGGTISPAELYAPSPANIDAAVGRLSQAYVGQPEDKRFQAIFIADGGNQFKNVMIALKKSKIDLTKVKLLGTGLWDDTELAQMPEMEGAWFCSSPPDAYQVFEKRFVATYGYKPVRLASLAYDAVTLVATLSMANPGAAITPAQLTVAGGFMSPANGLFRFNADGSSSRRLAMMEVSQGKFRVIDPALRSF